MVGVCKKQAFHSAYYISHLLPVSRDQVTDEAGYRGRELIQIQKIFSTTKGVEGVQKINGKINYFCINVLFFQICPTVRLPL